MTAGQVPPPAFYAVGRSGWRAWLTLLHPPYTLWHLSYVVVGGALAEQIAWDVLALTVLAFALALGIGAHALDELAGRPLGTTIGRHTLVGAAVVSVGLAGALGLWVARETTWWLLVPIALGTVLVPAYNLELAGGIVHNDLGFALAWGAFPVVTAYLAQTGSVSVAALLAAGWATLLSLAQRRLSTQARHLRRAVVAVSGVLELHTGERRALDRAALLATPESALRLLTWSTIAAAATLAARHLF